VLYTTQDHGANWRCCGLVDPEAFLADLGFAEAWELAAAEGARSRQSRRRYVAG